MKVIEHLEQAAGHRPLFSFEVIPPLRGHNVKDVLDVVEMLKPFNPAWIDVTTHSAGAYYQEKADGSLERRIYRKRPGSIGICGIIQNRFKIDTVAHLLCQGFTKEETEDALIELNYLGVQNVLALRGDSLNYEKRIDKSRKVNTSSSELVQQITNLNQGIYLDEEESEKGKGKSMPLNICVGVAGYPEKHFEAPNLAVDLGHLKEKVDAGAQYIVTQMFFDNRHYVEFVKMCREIGIKVPIIPGVKLLKTSKHLNTIPKNFYIDFPEELTKEVLSSPKNAEEIGTKWAIKQTKELLSLGAPCIHYFVMNDANQVIKVLKECK
jgi:methylenetetrahydrofolate reductase (NADPH)